MRPIHTQPLAYDDINLGPQARGIPWRFNASRLRALGGMVTTWLERSRQRRALGELNDRLLHDIGVTRAQARREAAKPFWFAGKT